MSPSSTRPVRVRFCPSPTGTPHVGLIRTALFNWAFARHFGGTFVFRIEDTDAARDSEESYESLLEAMRWLGLNWDEGPDIGGPHAPYRQSARSEIYTDVIGRLVAAGHVYESHSTPEDVAARHLAAGRNPKLGYDNYDRTADPAIAAALGRPPVLRLRMPDTDISFTDLALGPITFPAGTVPDPVLVRSTGEPLYTLVNPVDDATMGITHVLRGVDMLSSTARQIALYAALVDIGLTTFSPEFGHLPFVLGDGNRKLSKRDPEADLFRYRDEGFIAEGLLNYLALLGWSIGPDRDVFNMAEMAAAFDGTGIAGSPARFDYKKAVAINSAHLRELSGDDFAARLVSYLDFRRGKLSDEHRALVTAVAPLVHERSALLSDAADMIDFLLSGKTFTVDPAAAMKVLAPAATPVLAAAISALDAVEAFDSVAVETALHGSLVVGLGLKPRVAFAPIRVAVTGKTISPPLYESLALLGRDATLARLRTALATW